MQVTGGRNGFGAKLANIFSTRFVIETCDGKRKRRYRQVYNGINTCRANVQRLALQSAGEGLTC